MEGYGDKWIEKIRKKSGHCTKDLFLFVKHNYKYITAVMCEAFMLGKRGMKWYQKKKVCNYI